MNQILHVNSGGEEDEEEGKPCLHSFSSVGVPSRWGSAASPMIQTAKKAETKTWNNGRI